MTREEKLERALSVAMEALATYGSHPIIEAQSNEAILNLADKLEKEQDLIFKNSTKPWDLRKFEDEEDMDDEEDFTSYDSMNGICGLCGKVSCSGNCFK